MTIDLSRIVELCGKATPGPWNWYGKAYLGSMLDGALGGLHSEVILWPMNVPQGEPENWKEALGACGERTEIDAESNAAYIAACSPETILALCKAVTAAIMLLGHAEFAAAGLEHGSIARYNIDGAISIARASLAPFKVP